jgi:hypothetical protein
MIEIIDGPQLTLQVENRDLAVGRHPQRGSTRITEIVVNRKVVVRVRGRPDPGRLYRISMRFAGQSPIEAEYEGRPDETALQFRNGMMMALNVVVAAVGVGLQVLEVDPTGGGEDFGILIALSTDSTLSPGFDVLVKDLVVMSLDQTLPRRNASPFLINVPGQWQYRPGVYRLKPPGDSITGQPDVPAEFRYWHDHKALRRWVAAGTYMATFTRMTTMEAANESARHAVNAILYKICSATDAPPAFNYQGKLVADVCDIFDPEELEPNDLAYFKALDYALIEAGLPHFIDILKLPDLVMGWPQSGPERLALWDELVEGLMDAQVQLSGQASAASALWSAAAQTLIDQLRDLLFPT